MLHCLRPGVPPAGGKDDICSAKEAGVRSHRRCPVSQAARRKLSKQSLHRGRMLRAHIHELDDESMLLKEA